jgi:hypothetical protein
MISKQSTNLIAGLDIETLDLSPSAVVMDIGVVIYDLEKQVEVCATNLTPSISEQVIVGRTVSKDTINFHVRNYHKTLDSLVAHTSSFRPTIASVFNSMEELLSPVSEIWINGLSFDPVVLRSLFTSRGIDRLPWSYSKEVDVRSFRTLFKKYGLIGDMRALYAPFLRVEVVGAVAEMFGEAERKLFVTDQYVAFLCTGG